MRSFIYRYPTSKYLAMRFETRVFRSFFERKMTVWIDPQLLTRKLKISIKIFKEEKGDDFY